MILLFEMCSLSRTKFVTGTLRTVAARTVAASATDYEIRSTKKFAHQEFAYEVLRSTFKQSTNHGHLKKAMDMQSIDSSTSLSMPCNELTAYVFHFKTALTWN